MRISSALPCDEIRLSPLPSMLFNCLQCCKLISSCSVACPYCRIDLEGMIQKLEVSRKAEPALILAAPEQKQTLRLPKPGSLIYTAMAHITQIVQVMKAPIKRA